MKGSNPLSLPYQILTGVLFGVFSLLSFLFCLTLVDIGNPLRTIVTALLLLAFLYRLSRRFKASVAPLPERRQQGKAILLMAGTSLASLVGLVFFLLATDLLFLLLTLFYG